MDAPAATVGAASPSARPSAGGRTSRDSTVAFWEERQASGGGYETTLHLVDALIERARASGTLADLERAADLLDAVALTAPDTEAGLPLRRGRIAFALHDFRRRARGRRRRRWPSIPTIPRRLPCRRRLAGAGGRRRRR